MVGTSFVEGFLADTNGLKGGDLGYRVDVN